MAIMKKLKTFVAQEPVIAASCLLAGVGLFLPAVVRPILNPLETTTNQFPPPVFAHHVVPGKKKME